MIDDDKVMPDTFNIGWFIEEDEFGVPIEIETIKDAQDIETGYRFLHPIKDLASDLSLLKPTSLQVDRQRTHSWQTFLDDLLGDILPVTIQTGCHISTMLTHRVVELMGMQNFFMAIYDQPDAVHQLMAYLRDNALRRMRWMETEGLLRLNNGNQDSFGSSYNFSKRLPGPDYDCSTTRLSDLWGCSNSQETVGISPKMFREFCFPYYREVCKTMGTDLLWLLRTSTSFLAEISQLPNLKKVSISRWCDQQFIGDALRGTEIVFSRKPDPNS